MKKYFSYILIFIFSITIIYSCSDRDDNSAVPQQLQVQNFIWKGLNLYYLWFADVPELADNAFATQTELNEFLSTKGTPEMLFEDLLFKPVSKFPVAGTAVDRFSALVSDYTILENLFQGISTSTGLNFGLKLKTGSTTEVFGWVRYVLPNSSAASNNMQRGMLFSGINGTPLSVTNFQQLLSGSSYTLNMADYAGGAITPNGVSITLTKTALNENPVLLTQVYDVGTKKVGYIVYNSFTSNYESQLNAAFGQLKAANVTHLVLDLRYNGGGSVRTAVRLASMITGQFNDQVFAVEQWNSKAQTFFQANSPASLIEKFTNTLADGTPINSLNLSKVFVLTTRRTASASELVINGLDPYIVVDKIGDLTTGKNVGSITLYDSPNFTATNRNPNHKYAMQPLVIKTSNKVGFSSYQNGIAPTTPIIEDIGNLGQLGNINEPLLAAALQKIISGARLARPTYRTFSDVSNSDIIENPFSDQMYLDKLPPGLEKILRKE